MPRRDETFLLYYWEDFTDFEDDNPSCFYCLSESTVQIILSALRFSNWRTRWRLNRQDNSRRFSDNAIWDKIDAFASLAQQEVINDMSCDLQAGFQTLADAIVSSSNASAINRLADALARLPMSSCCADVIVQQNAGIQSIVTQPVGGQTIPVYGSQPGIGVEPETFPEGYESLEEYALDKCEMANLITDGIVATLGGLGVLAGVNIVGLGALIAAAAVGMVTIPPVAIPVILGALAVTFGIGAALGQLADYIQEHREQFVCILYVGETTDIIVAQLADAIDEALDALAITGLLAGSVKTIALVLVNSDTMNALFRKTAHALYPDADCSACEPCYDVQDEAWSLAEFGQNFSATNGVIHCEPTLDTSNNIYYAIVKAEGEWPTVSSVSCQIDCSPTRQYGAFVNLYDSVESYPDSPVTTDSAVFDGNEPVVFDITGDNIIIVRFTVRVDPAFELETFTSAEWSEVCIAP